MRLIDADALTKVLQRTSAFGCVTNSADKNVFEIISEQPTAYDVEKVVEQLESCLPCGRSYHDYAVSGIVHEYLDKDDVLKIVRKGGVE